MQPVTAPPSYPPTSYSSSQPTSYDQSSYSQQNTHGQPSSYGQQPPTSYTLRLDPTARLQVNIANRAAATGSRVHSDRTTPVAWVFYGQESEGFSRSEERRVGKECRL